MQVTVRASNFGALGAGAGVMEREQQLLEEITRQWYVFIIDEDGYTDYVLVNLPKRVMTGRSTPWRCAMTGCSSRLAGTNSYQPPWHRLSGR